VVGDPAPHERAVGQHGQVALAGGVEAGPDEPPGDAVAAKAAVGLGVQERDHAVAQVVIDEPGDLAVGEDLEPRPVRVVDDLQLHGASEPRVASPPRQRGEGAEREPPLVRASRGF
jgi:hypothetical protein